MTEPTDPVPEPSLPLVGDESVVADPVVVAGVDDGTATTASPEGADAAGRRPLPPRRAIVAWLAFALVAGALDGWVGAGVAVVVAAVVLAGLPRRLLGGLGVLALAGVPIAVLAGGLPDDAEVAPGFVSRSLWPHHLMFGGLALVAAWVVLDLGHQLRASRAAGHGPAPVESGSAGPLAGVALRVRVALVAVVAVAAVVASAAVLAQ